MINKKDKKGGEKIFSIWWFIVIVMIGVGITVGILAYFAANVDVRGAEARILKNRLIDCLTEDFILRSGVIEGSTSEVLEEFYIVKFDIFEECNLKQELFEEGSNFYFKIEFISESGDILREPIQEGNYRFEKDCPLSQKLIARKYPRCAEATENLFYYEEDKLKKGQIKILTASNNEGEFIP